ncbi:MAG TPA: hypothetical protein VJB66_02375 [Candidatus Nanoarchaeia archaeon]|nr:hypothetical protein [Candidatus Nanoarchaeia archaeon]
MKASSISAASTQSTNTYGRGSANALGIPKTATNQPEKKFRAGAVSVTVWKNTGQKDNGEQIEYQTISMERSYKDKSGEWKYTNSLRVNDLPKAGIALQKAYEYLVMRGDAVL